MGNTTIAIYGDSFAHRSFYSIEKAFSRNRYNEIRLIASRECLPFIDSNFDKNCLTFVNDAIKMLTSTRPDVIYLIFK